MDHQSLQCSLTKLLPDINDYKVFGLNCKNYPAINSATIPPQGILAHRYELIRHTYITLRSYITQFQASLQFIKSLQKKNSLKLQEYR